MAQQGRIFVLGSGTSEGVPIISCLLETNGEICNTCNDAQHNKHSKNKRRNTSIAICVETNFDDYERFIWSNIPEKLKTDKTVLQSYQKYFNKIKSEEGEIIKSTILIDIGKFFWQSALDLFPKLKLKRIEAILISHAHIDAMGGFDDLRDWTSRIQTGYSIPVYCKRDRDFEIIKSMYPYLLNANQTSGGGVSNLSFFPHLNAFLPISLFGLDIIPLPVYHGGSYVSFGFKFGDVVYISDCSKIPSCSTELINGIQLKNSKGSISQLNLSYEQQKSHAFLRKNLLVCKTLIIDCLSFKDSTHHSHFLIADVLSYLLDIQDPKPKKIYFTGLCHSVNHEEHSKIVNSYLESYGLDIDLLYDSQEIPFSYERNGN